MSLRPYAEYKDSGVAWLGKVPAHWEVKRLKQLIHGVESGVSVNAIDVPAVGSEIGVLKTSCVSSGFFDPFENKAVLLEEYDRVSCPVRKNTLIVSRMNTPALVGAAGFVTQDYPDLFLPDRLWQIGFKDISTAFLHYWTQNKTYRAQVEMACSGTSASMQNLGQDQFGNFWLACPCADETVAIAAFLDHETAKIDALITEQEKLIALLAEKRQAVISHAVTKGLNPVAPMKDSGIAWLGEVPAHWEVARIKKAVATIGQGWSPLCESYPVESADEWGVLKVGCVNGGTFTPEENKKLPEEFSPEPLLAIRKDDLLISRANTRELVGSAAVAEQNYPNLLLCDKLYRLRVKANSLLPQFIALFLASNRGRGQIELAASGASSSMLNIGQAVILDLPIPYPSENEQRQICLHVKNATAKLDMLRDEAGAAISLLKERRAALISAAVTGKIDVRNWQPEASAA
ncbi:restriction endonuclease subunit S [Chromobacterium amazonense]|uniref:Restriction endonuclease subunit S n=1 Tax=Chromobacterium amazonense TaxID=1382803 RepID=A0ABU8UW40_9NEIS|nr:restriction endonuclease subunit S [Chromobacterium amazonense]MDQ4542415.1 restriction endonuclease subunit S [Chromobacterium amazonense]